MMTALSAPAPVRMVHGLPKTLTANTLYVTDSLKGLQRLAPRSVDLVVTDLAEARPPLPVVAPLASRRPAEPLRRAELVPLLEECRRVMKQFNAYFFTTKMLLPVYLDFAVHYGLAWDVQVWERPRPGQDLAPGCEFIVSIWENGAWFNPDYKHLYQHKVKRHRSGRQGDKPLRLLEELLLQRSAPGHVVLDPACGTGAVPQACRQLGRTFLAFERSPQRCHEALQHLLAPMVAPMAAAAQLQLKYG